MDCAQNTYTRPSGRIALGCLQFCSLDGKVASRGFRHSNPQVAMPGGIITLRVERSDGSILSYEYNARVNSRDTYDNYIKRKKE